MYLHKNPSSSNDREGSISIRSKSIHAAPFCDCWVKKYGVMYLSMYTLHVNFMIIFIYSWFVYTQV
jgi:hypothetical protein